MPPKKYSKGAKKKTYVPNEITSNIPNLVIVESPGKTAKIRAYLGSGFMVVASVGHIMDLDEKTLSIDLETMTPSYVIPDRSKSTVAGLQKLAAKSTNIYIASDDDREGEFIGYSLVSLLGLQKYHRIIFHEITKKAIMHAMDPTNIKQLNGNMIYAQQCRRIIDRALGYIISPILKKDLIRTGKISPNTYSIGCGRVQSVIVRLIYDKCIAREQFWSNMDSNANTSYMTGLGTFKVYGAEDILTAKMCIFDQDPIKCSYTAMEKYISSFASLIRNNSHLFTITNKFLNQYNVSPPQPFITSSLQQDAYYKFHYNPDQTMLFAQKLYEKGLITYMRTDSPNLSSDSIGQIKDYICKTYGEKYSKIRQFKSRSKNAQEAHEAIRPTNIDVTASDVEELVDGMDNSIGIINIYNLIWCRTVASQMIAAINETTYLKIELMLDLDETDEIYNLMDIVDFAHFMTSTTKCVENGFKMVYSLDTEEETTETKVDNNYNNIAIGDRVNFVKLVAIESIGTSKPLYNQPSLIKELEKNGIGRPSTYAPSIKKIFGYKYVETINIPGIKKDMRTITFDAQKYRLSYTKKATTFGGEKQKIVITDLGRVLTEYLIKNYPVMMDYNFTSAMEEELDQIASGRRNHNKFLMSFKEQLMSWIQ